MRELKFVLKGSEQPLKGFKQISDIIGFPFQKYYSCYSIMLVWHRERKGDQLDITVIPPEMRMAQVMMATLHWG